SCEGTKRAALAAGDGAEAVAAGVLADDVVAEDEGRRGVVLHRAAGRGGEALAPAESVGPGGAAAAPPVQAHIDAGALERRGGKLAGRSRLIEGLVAGLALQRPDGRSLHRRRGFEEGRGGVGGGGAAGIDEQWRVREHGGGAGREIVGLVAEERRAVG